MQENNRNQIQNQKPDYLLYVSYIVMIAIIYFFYQNGAFAWINGDLLTTIKQYSFAFVLAAGVILLLANIYAVIGLALFYFLFKFALDLAEKANW